MEGAFPTDPMDSMDSMDDTFFASPSPSPPPYVACLSKVELPGGLTIYQPLLGLMAIFGLSIGFITYNKLKSQTSLKSYWTYSRMFFCFGLMNTTGLILNCLAPPNGTFSNMNTFQFAFGVLDGTFSSCTSFTFFWAVFSDAGWLHESSETYRKVLFGGYILIGILFAYGTFKAVAAVFLGLYVFMSFFGMLTFYIVSLIWNAQHKKFSVYLQAALLSGVIGFFVFTKSKFVCDALGPWINSETVWYMLSDLALLNVSLYFADTLPLRSAVEYILPAALPRPAAPQPHPSAPHAPVVFAVPPAYAPVHAAHAPTSAPPPVVYQYYLPPQ